MNGHNPDILTCLANLSADEVFTPPGFVNDIIDLVKHEWERITTRNLDVLRKNS